MNEYFVTKRLNIYKNTIKYYSLYITIYKFIFPISNIIFSRTLIR